MDPFKQFSHGDTLRVSEILFHTQFGYMFPLGAADPASLLPVGATTQGCLLSLGSAMATDDGAPAADSTIPAVFTYLGQFIDHDVTAQTDREIGVSRIASPDGTVMDIEPVPSSECTQKLINGRRPLLDLDQVYGDGPSLGSGAGPSEADVLFDHDLLFRVASTGGGFDVPRQKADGTAIIADTRNNENLNISQLHCAFLRFHNQVAQALPGSPSDSQRYIQARRLVRWAYQYVVVNDYLNNVCDQSIVADIQVNGPRYYSPNDNQLFIPLEFSVAAFRFGHSMIRPSYQVNDTTSLPLSQVLNVGGLLSGDPKVLNAGDVVQWHHFAEIAGQSGPPQHARRIDPFIASSLGELPVHVPGSSTVLAGPLLRHLAQRNLLRGYLLSVPTGQAISEAMQMKPLTTDELNQDTSQAVMDALVGGGFHTATPLWYYLLQEAQVRHGGNRLGPVGSRIVAETLYALVERDRAGYLNHRDNPAVTPTGIDVGGTVIGTIGDLLSFADVPL